jgi:hypothetical protein
MRGSGMPHELAHARTNGIPMTSSTAADKLLSQRAGSLAHILKKFFSSFFHILKKFFLLLQFPPL